jgi:predicted kinase
MTHLYLPIGVPGSGKSTFILKHNSLNDSDCIVSPDNYRRMLTGDTSDQSENTLAFNICHQIVRSRLKHGLETWLDATNLKPWDVNVWISEANNYDAATTVIVMSTPLDECLRRNRERERSVPERAMRRMIDLFTRNEQRYYELPATLVVSSNVFTTIK